MNKTLSLLFALCTTPMLCLGVHQATGDCYRATRECTHVAHEPEWGQASFSEPNVLNALHTKPDVLQLFLVAGHSMRWIGALEKRTKSSYASRMPGSQIVDFVWPRSDHPKNPLTQRILQMITSEKAYMPESKGMSALFIPASSEQKVDKGIVQQYLALIARAIIAEKNKK